MLRSVKDIEKYKVHSEGEEIASVRSFLFDEEDWKIEYLVVDTGDWFRRKPVLINPEKVEEADGVNMALTVSLSKSEIEESPSLREHQPVSRRKEEEIGGRYPPVMVFYPPEFAQNLHGPAAPSTPMPKVPKTGDEEKTDQEETEGEEHLRSTEEIEDYGIRVKDGAIGGVEDFIFDLDGDWKIRYLVVNTRAFLPGKKVLVSPDWIEGIDWSERVVHVDLSKENIKECPEFDPSEPVNRKYEEVMYDFYGLPKYWM